MGEVPQRLTLGGLFRPAFRRTELAAIARLRSRSFSSSAIFSENGRVARCCRIARLLSNICRSRSVIRFP